MSFELYFSVAEIATRLDKAPRSVRGWIAAGDFGTDVVNVAGDLRVPLSAIQAFLTKRRLDLSAVALDARRQAMQNRLRKPQERVAGDGVFARSPGELRRKLVRTSGRRTDHG